MPYAPCQIPQGFNYQAIARDGSGNPITNTTIKVKLSVLSDTTGFYGGTGGTYIWEEEHTDVKTNSFGMFTIVLGSTTATKVQGSATSFSAIDWSAANLFVGTKIAVSPSYVYKVMGSAKLWSVPFALRANTSADEKWSASGNNIYFYPGNGGKVGIWTSNPQTALTVAENNNTGITYPLYLVNASGDWTATEKGVGLKFGRISPTSGHDYGTIRGTIASANGGAGRLQFTGGPGTDPHMTIDYTGNVGIGITSPTEKLHVNGGISATSLIIGNSGQTTLRFVKSDNPADQRLTEFLSFGTSFIGRFVNDAYTLADNWLTVNRNPGTYTTNSVLISGGNFGVGTSAPAGRAEIQAPGTWPDDVPLFQVKNKLGVPVLAVYNNGVKILVEDTDGKGVKGGFAIGGFDPTKAAGEETVNLMMVTPDSVRINIDNNPAKAVKGGFAIGSFDATKAVNPREFMQVMPQSSYSGTYNTFIGYEAGKNMKGPHNTVIGKKAGYSLTGNTAAANIFIGEGAGMNNSGGYISYTLQLPDGSSTTAFNSWGGENVAIGYYSGVQLYGDIIHQSWGKRNVLLGAYSGYKLKEGYENTIIGYNAGSSLTTGHGNVFIGNSAGANETGSNRLYISNSNTSSPLIYGEFDNQILEIHGTQLISYNYPELTLYTNSGAAERKSAIYLYGTFGPGATDLTARNFAAIEVGSTNAGWSGAYFRVLGRVNDGALFETMKINTSNGDFYVSANAYKPGGGTWLNSSDYRLKDIHEPYNAGLTEIMNLNPYYFNYKNGNARNHNPETQYIGFVAQDVQKYLPEAVSEGSDGYLNLDMHVINVALVNAVKEQEKKIELQQQQIESQNLKNLQLQSELESLKERLSALEELLGNK